MHRLPHRPRRVVPAIAVAVLIGLTACTSDPSASMPTATQASSPTSTDASVVDGITALTAKGSLRGPVTGSVSVRVLPDRAYEYTFRMLWTAGDGGVRLVELTTARENANCDRSDDTEPWGALVIGQITVEQDTPSTVVLRLPAFDTSTRDLSHFPVLAPQDHALREAYCEEANQSFADLEWKRPTAMTTFRVSDSGPREFAGGTIVGEPQDVRSYEVVPGDRLSVIAERFGLTIDEIFWLNPLRQRNESPDAYVGEVLNLDTDARASSSGP